MPSSGRKDRSVNGSYIRKKMDRIKKLVLLTAIIVVGVVDVVMYWNFHLYSRAEGIEDSKKKIRILEKAIDFYPSNDLVFYELGRAYFDLGMNNLTDKARSSEYLRESIKNFSQSIGSNPASYFSHFNLAQSLLYMGYLFPDLDMSPHEEYKKAAALGGENSQIFYEVGKVFLSRWSQLLDEDKDFTLNILRKIVNRKDKERFRSLLYIWEMNVRDYNVIEKILIEDPQIYRIYAEFLGEKSLSLEERQKTLARAEFLEFEKAKEEYDSGEHEFLYYRTKEAFNRFKSSLNSLKKIKFYQNLSHQNLIDTFEFSELQKSALLNLAKCRIEQGEELKEVESYLREYLSLEDKTAALGDLESYLKNRSIIREKMEEGFNDLDRLSFELLLYFKQDRYREIMKIGRLLQNSFVVVPEGKKEAYVRVLHIVGDSYQKIDYIYDAGDFYQKALEVDSDNLETLVRIRRNYERLDSDKKIREINKKIEKIISPREKGFKNSKINKGRGFTYKLILDGRKVTLDLHFNFGKKGITPLISIFFNGRVVWEDFLKEEVLSIPIESKVGKNSLKVVPLNRTVSLVKLSYH